MRKSYIREKRTLCGDTYQAVGIYPVTDQEHRQRGKKRKERTGGRRAGTKPPACAADSARCWPILTRTAFT